MTPSTEHLLDAALALPADERAEFAEAVAQSLRPEGESPLDESWREVIQRRSAELDRGAVTPVPWEEVRRRARERRGG